MMRLEYRESNKNLLVGYTWIVNVFVTLMR